MGGTCSTLEGNEKCIEFLSVKFKARSFLQDVYMDKGYY
jgi:hypothetical protein